jgi:HD-GYP domain-containing protein (c-di-GMP phosphodiesterase class II)
VVADVFDALRSERPYRSALELDKVFNIMENEKAL